MAPFVYATQADRDAAIQSLIDRVTAIEQHPALSIPSLVAALEAAEAKSEVADVRNQDSQPGQ